MECPEPGVIATYVDNQLDEHARAEVESHADACDACRRLISQLARFASLGSHAPMATGSTRDLRGPLAATTPQDVALSDTIGGDGVLAVDGPRPGTVMGRYVVLYHIGRGGMGIVSAAYDPELDRNVAIKILFGEGDEARDLLVREARSLAKLAHENVVVVHDVGEVGGSVFVAMELVDGVDLGKWLQREPRKWRDIVKTFVAAGRGLAASHQAGLVHRDFKPANVLVSKSGRVLVTDFGLARAAARTSKPKLGTRATGIAGTPAYMSPEQLEGERADERSDQFSFCVSLWEGLYGTRPFAGKTFEELGVAVTTAEPATPPKSNVPIAVERALRRGLAKRPEDRFPSMTELLAVLERASTRNRGAWLAGGALAAVVTGAVAVAALRGSPEVCTGAAPKLAEVWNPQIEAAVERAFLATGKPYAAAAWADAKRAIDRHASAWVAMHVDTCKATAVRREQTPEVLDLRMTCLDRRRDELRAVLDVFARADAATVAHAHDALSHVGEVATCADVEALKAPLALPASPAIRALVAGLRQQLARALYLADAGKFREALGFVPTVLASARTLGYRPLEAEALHLLAGLQFEARDVKAATATFEATVLAAEASGHHLLAARAWRGLVVTVGIGQANYAEALKLANHAKAILGRLDPDGVEAAELEDTLSVVYRESGDFPAARASATRAIAIYEHELPAGDSRISRAYNQLANVQMREGKYEEALATFERIRGELEKSLGPNHPMVGGVLGNMADALQNLGRDQDALVAAKRGLAISEAALGKDHPELLKELNRLGNMAADFHRNDEALAFYNRGLSLAETAYGPDHPHVASLVQNIALVEKSRGNFAIARKHLERAVQIAEKRTGPDNIAVTNALGNLSALAVEEGKLDEAKRLAERSLAIRLRVLGPEHPDVATSYVELSNIAGASGNHRESIVLLQKSIAIEEKLGPDQFSLAISYYNLGNALYGIDDWAKAQAALDKSLAIMEKTRPGHPYTADVLTVIAATLDKQGKPQDALPVAEHALAIREKSDSTPEQVAETRETVARLLWQTPAGDRERAKQLAKQALAAYTTDTPEVRSRKDELVKWMTARSIPR